MTTEQTAPGELATMISRPGPLPPAVGAQHAAGLRQATGANLRERLAEFRALLVILLLMTESVSEDQILELAASSAPGLGPARIEGYGFSDGQWRAAGPTVSGISISDISRQLAALGDDGGKVDLPSRR